VSTVLSSNQSTPVAKESGANTHPWRTPVSIANQELSDCDARTQPTELLYLIKLIKLIKLTILSGIPSLVNRWLAYANYGLCICVSWLVSVFHNTLFVNFVRYCCLANSSKKLPRVHHCG